MAYKPEQYVCFEPVGRLHQCTECPVAKQAITAASVALRELRDAYDERGAHVSRRDPSCWMLAAKMAALEVSDPQFAASKSAYATAVANCEDIRQKCPGGVRTYPGGGQESTFQCNYPDQVEIVAQLPGEQ